MGKVHADWCRFIRIVRTTTKSTQNHLRRLHSCSKARAKILRFTSAIKKKYNSIGGGFKTKNSITNTTISSRKQRREDTKCEILFFINYCSSLKMNTSMRIICKLGTIWRKVRSIYKWSRLIPTEGQNFRLPLSKQPPIDLDSSL